MQPTFGNTSHKFSHRIRKYIAGTYWGLFCVNWLLPVIAVQWFCYSNIFLVINWDLRKRIVLLVNTTINYFNFLTFFYTTVSLLSSLECWSVAHIWNKDILFQYDKYVIKRKIQSYSMHEGEGEWSVSIYSYD